MKKTIAVINHKGGVGKTTTVVNLGAALNKLGFKVLLIDLDPQANLTIHLGKDPSKERNIYNALRGEYPLPITTIRNGFDLVCSTLDLSVAELELSNIAGREYLVTELVEPVKDNYDYILYDCPPSLTFLTMNALAASQMALIPIDLQSFAIIGMSRIFEVMDIIRKRINPNLKDCKILITRKDLRKTVQKELLQYMYNNYAEKVFSTSIRLDVKIEESQLKREDIFTYFENSPAAVEYLEVAKEVIALK